MPKSFKDLTDEQKKKHEEALKRAGIDRGSVAKNVVIESHHHHHHDAARVGMKIHKIRLRDVHHMKEIGGVPDTAFSKGGASDSHISYPAALKADRQRVLSAAKDADTLHAALTAEERDLLSDAMRAYVLGDSRKVEKDLVKLVNVLSFPMDAGIVAADDLTITEPYVVTGPGPQKIVAGTITIVKPNGQIIAEGVDLSIEAQYIEVTNG